MPSGVRLEATEGLRWAGASHGGYGWIHVTLGEEWDQEERGCAVKQGEAPPQHAPAGAVGGEPGTGHWLLVGS